MSRRCGGSQPVPGAGHGGGAGVPQVRGAPAIALVGCLSLAVELAAGAGPARDAAALEAFVGERLRFLGTARPTAVNLAREQQRLLAFASRQRAQSPGIGAQELRERYRGWGGRGDGRGAGGNRGRGVGMGGEVLGGVLGGYWGIGRGTGGMLGGTRGVLRYWGGVGGSPGEYQGTGSV